MNLEYLFAVPFATIQHPSSPVLNKRLLAVIFDAEAAGDEFRSPTRRSTQHGSLFESRFDLFRWPQPAVRELSAFCHGSLSDLVQRTSNYSRSELNRLIFDYHAWFHVTRDGGFQGLHNHQNASWSGIYCVDPGDQFEESPSSGLVRFHDPRPCANYYSDAGNQRQLSPGNFGAYDLKHKAGQLVLFPSYLYHEIFVYKGRKPRIVIAFNAWIRLK